MYIRGLIPRNFTELAEAVPIETNLWHREAEIWEHSQTQTHTHESND